MPVNRGLRTSAARLSGDRVAAEIAAALDGLHQGGALGVAVSGGGDSMALLLVAADWARSRGVALSVATVDHRLRPESAAEAAFVADLCARLGLPHRTLAWRDWDGAGNLQAAARDARRRLLADWAAEGGLSAILLGHTLDDQAETVLMRLGRGAGVDGLSAMTASTEAAGLRWLRPMLGQRREALRAWLSAGGHRWVDDPSNENERFDRVKARRAIAALGELGVTAEGLAATAERMQAAREALEHATETLADDAARWGRCGELRIRLEPLRRAPPELARRLLRAGLTRAAGAEYGPRGDAERRLLSAMLSLRLGGGRALHGCLVRPDGVTGAVISREASAVDGARRPPPAGDALWDGRFRLSAGEGVEVAPLGEAGARRLAQLAEDGLWRAPDHWRAAPLAARLTTPALWRADRLEAAPVAGFGEGAEAEFAAGGPRWFAAA